IRRVRARIDGGVAIEPEDAALVVRVDRNVVGVLAAVGIRRELLAPVLEPANWHAELFREPAEAHFFGQQDALVAEAAADVRRDDAYRALVDAEAFRESR